ncbi:MAG: hypothetical protein Q4A32_11965 [Lachnospiraceae bacterium]|nr:hypothetical protein [Lachnospiraceae bacterium]
MGKKESGFGEGEVAVIGGFVSMNYRVLENLKWKNPRKRQSLSNKR